MATLKLQSTAAYAGERANRPTRIGTHATSAQRLMRGLDAVDRLPARADARDRARGVARHRAATDAELGAAVAADPALTAAVLRFTNTYGGTAAATPHQAVCVLGHARVEAIVGNVPVYSPDDCADPWLDHVDRFRTHALLVSRVARSVARHSRNVDPEQAATVALLHDIGRLVILHMHPEVAETGGTGPAARLAAERDGVGIDHATVGGLVARRWSIPAVVATAVERHHGDDAGRLAQVVRLADLLVHRAAGARVAWRDVVAVARVLGLSDRELDDAVLGAGADPAADRSEPCPLTPRQLEILQGLAAGRVYSEIGRDLGLKPSTVRSHVHAAYERLGVADRAQAVLLAVARGWIPPPTLASEAAAQVTRGAPRRNAA